MSLSIQSFAARSESLPALMDFIALRSSTLGLPRGTSLRLQLVAEELFTNTFRHGRTAGASQMVTLCIEQAGEDIELTYEDGELAWDPLSHRDCAHLQLPLAQRPVGGLGVLLVDAFAERMQYERVQERNRVRVWLRCDPQENP
ncbi:ATP-binding protein [Nevskia soli]|uniref:ATP-binding protein n=1 Tax=Nevskia soli TaxID=418856 RepID=UPI000A06DBDD|nr:ATP-binding protein [Nevskia soli]